MTRARDAGDRVVVELSINELDTYIKPLTLLAEAEDRLRRLQPELSGPEIRALEAEYWAAYDDVRYALSEDLTISSAEFLHRQLGAAITRAKVFRGDFEYHDDETA